MAEKVLPQGLGFADVLLVPQYSDIRSRYGDQIDTSTRIARGMPPIHIPIISSNMDTVTESKMAIAMALHGGIGIIHRFMTAKQQAEEIRKVKETMRVMEDDPPLITDSATIGDALDLLRRRPRGYVLAYSGDSFSGQFSGIATTRDFLAAPADAPIAAIMTPREKIITVMVGTTREQAVEIMKSHRIEKIPVIGTDGMLVGVYTLNDSEFFQRYPNASLDREGRLMVGAAIGVQNGDVQRAHMLQQVESDVLVLDIAHGHLIYTAEMLKQLKVDEGITVPIIAGNVATREGTIYLRDSGADGGKIGVGAGLVCDTRSVAGSGRSQITAVMEAAEAVANDRDPMAIISDGGTREPGDIPKAIGAGADAVMIGSLFAGTDESPGEPVLIDGTLQNMVRGMASASAFRDRQALGDSTTDKDKYVPEGRTIFTPYKGPVSKVISNLVGGLRSGMSYTGAHTIDEMKKRAKFQIIPSGTPEQRREMR